MGISPANIISLLVFTSLLAVGQFLFKAVALRVQGLPLLASLTGLLLQPLFYVAITLYAVSILLWIWILGRVPLSQAYPWMSLGVILVPLVGQFVFGENIRPIFWGGAALIVAGIVMTQYGSN
jgi:multidrug transporter EmrE-like cation transporter